MSSRRTINTRVVPTWTDSVHFWFRLETETGGTEIVDVNAVSGEMSIQTGDRDAEQVTRNSRQVLQGGPIPNSGPDSVDNTEILFVNQSNQKVRLFWINSGGERVAYGVLAPGNSHRQHTYAGHAWEASGTDGTFFGSMVADRAKCEAVIHQSFPRVARTNKSLPRVADKTIRNRYLGTAEARIKDGRLEHRINTEAAWENTNAVNDLVADGQSLQHAHFSPDGTVLAVWKGTPGDRSEVFTIESSPAGGGRAKLNRRPYLLPGDQMDKFELILCDTKSWEIIPLETPSIDFENPRFRWKGEHDLLLEKVDRGHQRFRLFVIDPIAKSIHVAIDEVSKTFIWTMHGPPVPLVTYLEQTNEVIYASEMSGWRHLYLVDLSGERSMQAITKGEFVVRKLVHVDEDKKLLDIEIGGFYEDQDPYHRHLAHVDFGGENFTVITDGNGDHECVFSPDRRFVVDTFSRVDLPPVHELRDASSGKLIVNLCSAKRLVDDRNTSRLPEVFACKGRDGVTDIWGMIAFPEDFDPASTKRYPIIEAIYAGPHDSHVPKRYRDGTWSEEYTSMGFAVVRIDGMGTANRSKAFHDKCWHNLQDAGFPDRIAWIKAVAEKYPALDIDRVGIYGTSAGGQNACGAMVFHGDFYKAAMASCGCHDNRMDKASWNEQWMGFPVGPQYSAASNIDQASRLNGHLLLLVGELDENVPPESTLRLVDALIRAGKRFDFLMIPGMGHSDGGTYGRQLTLEFFREKLTPPAP